MTGCQDGERLGVFGGGKFMYHRGEVGVNINGRGNEGMEGDLPSSPS